MAYSLKIVKRAARCIIVTGMMLFLAASVKGTDETPFFGNTAPAFTNAFAITAQAAELNQSDRWEGQGDTWRVQDGSGGYLKNSWFQDNDGSWYMLGAGDGSEMFAGLIVDKSTGKSYYLETQHKGFYGKMCTKDGEYEVNGSKVYLKFNQNHDGSFGAVISGLNEIRSTGVNTRELASIPTDSAASQTQTSQQPTQTQTQRNSDESQYYEGIFGGNSSRPASSGMGLPRLVDESSNSGSYADNWTADDWRAYTRSRQQFGGSQDLKAAAALSKVMHN